MEIASLFPLICLNGLFAVSEIALVTALVVLTIISFSIVAAELVP